MKLGGETNCFRIAPGKEESGRLEKGPWRVGREKEWRHPGRALDYFTVEEVGRFNCNPDVELETGKPIDAPDHKDQEHSF
jgi:hypothetical protein